MTQDLQFDPSEFLQRCSVKTGFTRERYIEKNIPTDIRDILVLFFFGSYKARFLLSSMLLKGYINKIRKPRYTILCSWSGDSGLYPYVNEYWSLNDESNIMERANLFTNEHPSLSTYESNLLRYFTGDVLNGEIFSEFYNDGFTKRFFDLYKEIDYYLPSVPSLPVDTTKRISKSHYSVFIHPSKRINIWHDNKPSHLPIASNFWELLIGQLIDEAILPIVWIDSNAYDVSPVFTNKCLYINNKNIMHVIAAMRASTCVLDVCNDTSKLALLARAPFILSTSRQKYFASKDVEIDDLCASEIQHDYVFMFNSFLDYNWSHALLPQIVSKVKKFLPNVDRNKLMSSAESSDILSYDNVKERKSLNLGLRFIESKNLEL